jgi:hypothetical protein
MFAIDFFNHVFFYYYLRFLKIIYIFRTELKFLEAMEIYHFPLEIHSFAISTELLKQ